MKIKPRFLKLLGKCLTKNIIFHIKLDCKQCILCIVFHPPGQNELFENFKKLRFHTD